MRNLDRASSPCTLVVATWNSKTAKRKQAGWRAGQKTTTEIQTLLTLVFMRRSIISMIFAIIYLFIYFFAPRKMPETFSIRAGTQEVLVAHNKRDYVKRELLL